MDMAIISFLKEDDDPQFEEDEQDDDSEGAGGSRELKLENDVDFKRALTERFFLSGAMGLLWNS